jgi:hypothetical protein
MQRRQFLVRGALGGLAVAALGGGYLALRRSPGAAQPTERLVALTPLTFGVVAALAGVHITAEGRDPIAIAHAVDKLLIFQAPEQVRDLNRALAAFETGLFGLFTRGSFRTFTELGEDAQRAAVRAWSEASIPLLRATCDSLRRLTVGAHYAQLANAKALGYPGPPFEKPDPPPIVADQPLSPPFEPGALPGAAPPDDEPRDGGPQDGGPHDGGPQP